MFVAPSLHRLENYLKSKWFQMDVDGFWEPKHAVFEAMSSVLVKEITVKFSFECPFIAFNLPQKRTWEYQMTEIRGIFNDFGRKCFIVKSSKLTPSWLTGS